MKERDEIKGIQGEKIWKKKRKGSMCQRFKIM